MGVHDPGVLFLLQLCSFLLLLCYQPICCFLLDVVSRNPSTDDVQKKATDWLVTQKKKKGTQLDKKEEASVLDIQGSSHSSTKPNQNSGQHNRCSVCNSTKHDRDTCKHRSTAHCNRCEKDGHFPQACRSKAKSGAGGKGKGGPWKGKDKAKASVKTTQEKAAGSFSDRST